MGTIHQFRVTRSTDSFDGTDFEIFRDEHAADAEYDPERLRVKERLIALHDELYPRIREMRWDLYPANPKQAPVSPARVSGENPRIQRLTLGYAKPQTLRRMMQKRYPGLSDEFTAHAQLAVTVEHDGLATELIVSRQAWVDAENFRNKALGGSPEKQQLRLFVSHLNDFVVTFEAESEWVSRAQATRWVNLGVLNGALEKFKPRSHTLRVRARIPPHHENLALEKLPGYIIDRFVQLYPLYSYLAWSPKNNYVSR